MRTLAHCLVLIPCCTMINEMGGFASAQAVVTLLNSQNVNIAWDAMTLNGVHIHEMRVDSNRLLFKM